LDDLYGTKDYLDIKYANLKGNKPDYILEFYDKNDKMLYKYDIKFEDLISLISICIKKELPIYDLQNQGNNWNQFYD
jgi:hypothetical protein